MMAPNNTCDIYLQLIQAAAESLVYHFYLHELNLVLSGRATTEEYKDFHGYQSPLHGS